MIKEFEFYHGAVLSKLIHCCSGEVAVSLYPSTSNASYILNGKIGIYIKHCTKRLSPWRFSFKKIHQDEILEMKNVLGDVFVLLVCHEDGIVTLSYEELKLILDESHEQIEWISAARLPKKEYTVKGSDGGLNYKIGKKDFPRKIFASLQHVTPQI